LTLLQSIVLGLVQGVTEFLPISSSAHLILIPWFFGFSPGGMNYDVMLHFATLFATLLVYGRAFFSILGEAKIAVKNGSLKETTLAKIFFASLPAFFFGYFFNDQIERNLRNPYVCATMLILVSILMIVAEGKKGGRASQVNYLKALSIGLAQAIALIPGTSRSGITITFGLLLGLERKKAVDFSFLLSIPVILGAAIYELRHLTLTGENTLVYMSGMVSAIVAGVTSLKFLIGYLKRHSLRLFAFYRILLAILILMLSK
jgi:undecaprenyl-diphosphatase